MPNREQQHTPLLFNPFINALFNHPNASNSPLKGVMKAISSHPEDFALLVPETASLWLSIEETSRLPYRDFCHHTEFVEAHIVHLRGVGPGKSNRRFRTLSGREVTIFEDEVIGMKGFQAAVTAKITRKELFRSFAAYLPFGAYFQVFYINRPLVGTPVPRGVAHTSAPTVERATKNVTTQTQSSDVKLLVNVLRQAPVLSQVMNSQFRDLFQAFSAPDDESSLLDAFNAAMTRGVEIFSQATANTDEIDRLFADFTKANPTLNINECFYTYIEMNIYEKIWPKYLRIHNTDELLNGHYRELRAMSLTQVGVPDYSTKTAPATEKRINAAIEQFKQLTFSDCASEKRSILMATFRELTGEAQTNADTLVGLFIMVIVHAQVKDLYSHLAYIKSFSFASEDLDSGVEGYVVSTFEAVLSYLNDEANLEKLLEHSRQNQRLWDLIRSSSTDQNVNNGANDPSNDSRIAEEIAQLLEPYSGGDNIPQDSFIRARTLQGESCLMLAVQQNNKLVFKTLIHFERIFTLDDILEDRNICNSSLLAVALQWKNNDVVDELADIVLQATESEKADYCSLQDNHRRNLGHYLAHRHELIAEFGRYIDWTVTDNNKQSPFFAITRCYDHPRYYELLESTILAVREWYDLHNRAFDYRDHVDLKGNTILHSVKDGRVLGLYLKCFDFVDVNALNSIKLTPLMVYVKYSRLENIKVLLGDSKLDIARYDDKYCLTAADYVKIDKGKLVSDSEQKSTNEKIEELLDYAFLKENMPTHFPKAFGTVRMKYDSNHELCLFLKGISHNNTQLNSTWHTFQDFKKMLRLMKLECPFTFFDTSNDWFPSVFDVSHKPNINYSARLKLNYHQTCVNVVTAMLLFNSSTYHSETLSEFLLTSGPINEQERMKKLDVIHKKNRDLLLSDKADPAKMLKPDLIGDIQTFMKYSLKELASFKSVFDRMYRSLVLYETKCRDLEFLRGSWLNFSAGDVSLFGISSKLDLIPTRFLYLLQETIASLTERYSSSLCSQDKLSIYIYYLTLATSELVSSIESFIANKVNRWWDIYGELLALNDELLRVKSIDEAKRENAEIQQSALSTFSSFLGYMSGTVVNDMTEDGSEISQVPTEEMIPKRSNDPLTGSFLTEIIAGRRHKYSKKILDRVDSLHTELAVLNLDIRQGHERIAVEISNFYVLKHNVIKLMLQQHAKQKIRELKFKNMALQKGLENYKRRFI